MTKSLTLLDKYDRASVSLVFSRIGSMRFLKPYSPRVSCLKIRSMFLIDFLTPNFSTKNFKLEKLLDLTAKRIGFKNETVIF